MKNYLLSLSFLLTYFFSLNSFAGTQTENWEFLKYDEYCIIQSSPIKTEIPDGKTRGDFGLIVYRINKSPDLIIQITPGFNYESVDSVKVKIDNQEYSFYTDTEVAWAKDDKKIIYAMKKGLEFTTTGISSKGTKVVDTYSLKGFTSSVKKLSKDC